MFLSENFLQRVLYGLAIVLPLLLLVAIGTLAFTWARGVEVHITVEDKQSGTYVKNAKVIVTAWKWLDVNAKPAIFTALTNDRGQAHIKGMAPFIVESIVCEASTPDDKYGMAMASKEQCVIKAKLLDVDQAMKARYKYNTFRGGFVTQPVGQ